MSGREGVWRRSLRGALVALALVGAWLSAGEAWAWDLEAIARTREAAERAYDAGDYVEAARHYDALRGLLASALEAGAVPESVAPQARAAWLAATYQLGRAQQQSQGCDAALGSYDALVDAASGADASLRARARARSAEAHVCIAQGALEAGQLAEAAHALTAANTALNALGQMLATELLQTPDEIPAILAAAHEAIQTTTADATQALALRIDAAAGEARCDELEALLAIARDGLPRALPTDSAALVERCRTPRPDPALAALDPRPATLDNEASVPWWPGLLIAGLGGASLIGAATWDGLLAADVDAYDRARSRCGIDDVDSCHDARRRRSDIEGQQDAVVALYITGGVLVGAGAVYTLVALLAAPDDGDDDSGPALSVAPSGDGGLMSSVRWRF